MFEAFGEDISYQDIIQLDGAFSVAHINYGQSPVFSGNDGRLIAVASRKDSLSSRKSIEDVLESIESFDGTEQGLKKEDRIELWKNYWLEYINAFDKLTQVLPQSVVTIYVGRHAVEVGFKYLLFLKKGTIEKGHDLEKLSKTFSAEHNPKEEYLEWIDEFCEKYQHYIEGGNAEYFRYPEYKSNLFFAGNRLDIKWISYNFALILLKLLHFIGYDGLLK